MRVLHFILGKANKERANGVNQVIAGLAKYSARHGADVRVLGMAQSVEGEGEIIPRDGFAVTAFSRPLPAFFSELARSIRWADVVHLHGVFSPWNIVVGRACLKHVRPYVVTLHGGLAPERMKTRGTMRKRVFHSVVQKQHLEQAAGIHVLTEEESTEAFSWFRPRYLCCVSNGVDLDEFPALQPRERMEPAELVLGYMGRLSPEKNLDALCRAVASVRRRAAIRLVLAGPDSPYLRGLIARYSGDGVSWVGPRYGADKLQFLRSVDLFVHPSLCDVFSIAAMEVMAIGTPLLITRTADASYFFDRKAFFMCEPTAFGIERGLDAALRERSEWPDVAARGRALVEKQLNWSAASRSLLSHYAHITEASRR